MCLVLRPGWRDTPASIRARDLGGAGAMPVTQSSLSETSLGNCGNFGSGGCQAARAPCVFTSNGRSPSPQKSAVGVILAETKGYFSCEIGSSSREEERVVDGGDRFAVDVVADAEVRVDPAGLASVPRLGHHAVRGGGRQRVRVDRLLDALEQVGLFDSDADGLHPGCGGRGGGVGGEGGGGRGQGGQQDGQGVDGAHLGRGRWSAAVAPPLLLLLLLVVLSAAYRALRVRAGGNRAEGEGRVNLLAASIVDLFGSTQIQGPAARSEP